MSNVVNEGIMEEAAFYMDYFEGKLIADLIREDIRTNDLEMLAHHVQEARIVAFEAEYNPYE